MQEQHLYEYAVMRIVPRVEREEFINIGVVLYCARKKFLQSIVSLDATRLKAFAPGMDAQEITAYIHSFQHVCRGDKEGGTIATLPLAERFRWLTAVRSTVLQTSRIHPGLCCNPEEALSKLFHKLVQ